jgi:hypothetical protein
MNSSLRCGADWSEPERRERKMEMKKMEITPNFNRRGNENTSEVFLLP